MDNTKVKQIADNIFKDVFESDNPFSLEELQKKFAIDIPNIKKNLCSLSGQETWSLSNNSRIASQSAIEEKFKEDEWMKPPQKINSLEDIFHAWTKINYEVGDKYIDSTNITASNNIFNSDSVYQSASIFNSKNIIFGYNQVNCDSMLASRDNESCTMGVRIKESSLCSSSFEISWSQRISKSMFIHDGVDLYECMFCSHIRSKKYCIANMQFEKEEYFRLKKLVIEWILSD